MADQKSSNQMSGLAGMYLLVIGIVLLVLAVVIWGAGGQGIVLFVLGAVMLIAWLVIKAARS